MQNNKRVRIKQFFGYSPNFVLGWFASDRKNRFSLQQKYEYMNGLLRFISDRGERDDTCGEYWRQRAVLDRTETYEEFLLELLLAGRFSKYLVLAAYFSKRKFEWLFRMIEEKPGQLNAAAEDPDFETFMKWIAESHMWNPEYGLF